MNNERQSSENEWNKDGLALCCCHGHLDGLTLAQMRDEGAPCPTEAHWSARVAAAYNEGVLAQREATRAVGGDVGQVVKVNPYAPVTSPGESS